MKQIIKIIVEIIILVLLIGWIALIITDYFRMKNGKDLLFCLSEQTIEYADGTNYICNGLGDKMIRYNRTCLTATEFGPFFIQERQCE